MATRSVWGLGYSLTACICCCSITTVSALTSKVLSSVHGAQQVISVDPAHVNGVMCTSSLSLTHLCDLSLSSVQQQTPQHHAAQRGGFFTYAVKRWCHDEESCIQECQPSVVMLPIVVALPACHHLLRAFACSGRTPKLCGHT